MGERIEENAWERTAYEIALKASGAVQAHRWTELPAGIHHQPALSNQE